MPQPLEECLAVIGAALARTDDLIKAGASGRQRGRQPAWERISCRVVDLKAGPHLQWVEQNGPSVRTVNIALADPEAMARAHRAYLVEPFSNWHVETTTELLQLRVTKKGEGQLHRALTSKRSITSRSHDRVKQHLIAPDDPLFDVLGSGADADKRRQVDAFLRLLEPVIRKYRRGRTEPLSVVDLGCGNAYLTFAAHRLLQTWFPGTTTVGIDRREDLMIANAAKAERAGLDGLTFASGDIDTCELEFQPDVVLALHACDTATDHALARAIGWQAPIVLAAPCCHADIQRQISALPRDQHPAGYDAITQHPILRERFADVMTDALRAALIRRHGYKVDVVEFIDSTHTPRNAMIRAVRTSRSEIKGAAEPVDLALQWRVRPILAALLTSPTSGNEAATG